LVRGGTRELSVNNLVPATNGPNLQPAVVDSIDRKPTETDDVLVAAKVLLKDIIEALEMQFEEYSNFLDLETGRVEAVSDDLLGQAEEAGGDEDEEPSLPDWQRDEWETAQLIVSFPDRFKPLPTKFDIHEWSIMQDFAHSMRSEPIRDELLNAIHGKGAFRYFKDNLRRHRIEQAWYDFHSAALRQIAIDWCEENQVEWR
jgi:hypothetical protein